MKRIKSSFAAAVLSIAVATPAVMAASQVDAKTVVETCNGQPYSGEYIVKAHPSFAPIIADNFNSAAGEKLVSDVKVMGAGYLLIKPETAGTDCNEFMDKIKDTGIVEYIGPNYIVGIPHPIR